MNNGKVTNDNRKLTMNAELSPIKDGEFSFSGGIFQIVIECD